MFLVFLRFTTPPPSILSPTLSCQAPFFEIFPTPLLQITPPPTAKKKSRKNKSHEVKFITGISKNPESLLQKLTPPFPKNYPPPPPFP